MSNERREFVSEIEPSALLADGFDHAIIGVGIRCGQPTIAAYDAEFMRLCLRIEHGMDEADAIEYFDHNIAGGWLGEMSPIFIELFDKNSLQQQIRELKIQNTKLLLKIAEYEAREY